MGAAAYGKATLSCLRFARRHSPSSCIATFLASKAFCVEYSSPKVDRYFSSFVYPPSALTRFCWSFRNVVTAGSSARLALPSGVK